jgi:hypothetical protein
LNIGAMRAAAASSIVVVASWQHSPTALMLSSLGTSLS